MNPACPPSFVLKYCQGARHADSTIMQMDLAKAGIQAGKQADCCVDMLACCTDIRWNAAVRFASMFRRSTGQASGAQNTVQGVVAALPDQFDVHKASQVRALQGHTHLKGAVSIVVRVQTCMRGLW